MAVDLEKISYLIERQVPEFVRDDYPKFVSFLKAYYEFLENAQGTEKNDLITKSKELKYVSDVDQSLDDFEDHFFDTYLNLLPKDIAINKAFLIKNILPFYLSKGSEDSFKFLFSLLYGEEIQLQYPRDNILRASDGKWIKEKIIRIFDDIYSLHDGDGSTQEFILAQSVSKDDISVYIDDVLQTSGYNVNSNVNKLIFDVAPIDGSAIRVLYNSFDITLIENRKITGNTSSAYAIVEKTGKSVRYGKNYFQLFIDDKTLKGIFDNSEKIKSDIIGLNDTLISLELTARSELDSINIIDGGADYNIGDSVVISGSPITPARAIVSEIVSGTVDNVSVTYGGSGFQVNNTVSAEGYANTVFNAYVFLVDTSGTKSANTLNVTTDIIAPFSSTLLSATDYGFPASVDPAENTTTVIANALSTLTLTNLGPITQVEVNQSYITVNPTLNANSPTVNGSIQLVDLGIIGRIEINNGGLNYQVGDLLTFTNQPNVYVGFGANAQVATVNANGTITGITINSGGGGYRQTAVPTLNVSSANGTGANLTVSSVMGDGEILQTVYNGLPVGQIIAIKILDGGAGYAYVPLIDLTGKGNGQATANAAITPSTISLPGRWKTTDSIISSDDRRLEGRDYYINFAYVIQSRIEFAKYKDILKKLIHPSGFAEYGEYMINPLEIVSSNISTNVFYANTISGTVNTNSSIYVVGTNTKFNIANTLGILIPGSNIAINSQIRTVNTIVSNTVLTVTSAFTINTSGENIVVL